MTKVEELRNGTIFAYELGEENLIEFTERLRALIISAHAAGYAECKGEGLERVQKIFKAELTAAREEGAEQERERIVRGSQRFSQGDDVSDSDYITTDYATKIDFAAVADCELFIAPVSVLSPAPKEEKNYYAVGDKGESGESHSAASSGGYWKATYVSPPDMTFGPAGAVPAPKEEMSK